MKKPNGYQRKYLRGLAHGMKTTVMIGQKGITDMVINEIDEALERHELIKVKFTDFKEKMQKKDFAYTIEEKTNSHLVGMIGHTVMFYRQGSDPKKRKISVPER